MGRLTRRVKFLAKERRLSIPAEFLNQEGLSRGDCLVAATSRGVLWVFSEGSWRRHKELVERLRHWYPNHDHPYLAAFDTWAQVRVGSQDRVVLPRDFPFRSDHSLRLSWEIRDSILRLEIESSVPGALASSSPSQGSLLDYMPISGSGASIFQPGSAKQDLVQQVPTKQIARDDRSWAVHEPFPPEALVRAIQVEGMRTPLLLMEQGDSLIVIDGFLRLEAARTLKLPAVPAIVLPLLDTDVVQRIRLAMYHDDVAESPALSLMRSTLKLHEGQVALSDIEKITGRRKRTLQRYLRVAGDEVLRGAVERGQVSIFKAEEILKAGIDPEQAIRKRLTVTEIRAAGLRRKRGGRRRAGGEREGS